MIIIGLLVAIAVGLLIGRKASLILIGIVMLMALWGGGT